MNSTVNSKAFSSFSTVEVQFFIFYRRHDGKDWTGRRLKSMLSCKWVTQRESVKNLANIQFYLSSHVCEMVEQKNMKSWEMQRHWSTESFYKLTFHCCLCKLSSPTFCVTFWSHCECCIIQWSLKFHQNMLKANAKIEKFKIKKKWQAGTLNQQEYPMLRATSRTVGRFISFALVEIHIHRIASLYTEQWDTIHDIYSIHRCWLATMIMEGMMCVHQKLCREALKHCYETRNDVGRSSSWIKVHEWNERIESRVDKASAAADEETKPNKQREYQNPLF